jgi:hypothetical protein
MRRGDAQHRRAARKETFADLERARELSSRAFPRSGVHHTRAKAQLSYG